MKGLLAFGLILLCLDAAAQLPALQPGNAITTSVTLDKGALAAEAPHPLQYMSGVVSCEMPPPGTEKGINCPAFAVSFTVKNRLEATPDLGEHLRRKSNSDGARSPKALTLDSDRRLHYTTGSLEFEFDIGRYFLPNTVIRRQWSVETGTSDALFLISETCDGYQSCRSGLWFFAVDKKKYRPENSPDFRSSAVALPGKVNWLALETDLDFGPRAVGDRLALFLPMQGGPVVAWLARFVEHQDHGIRELHYEVYPAEWPVPKKD